MTVKEAYSTLVETRNLEIHLFWQRANYFLVLNSALALGFFNLTGSTYAAVFIILGILASWLWYQVCLGGKYWQTRWEQRLMDYESEHLPDLAFFAADKARIAKDVEKGLTFHPRAGIKKWIYDVMAKTKPSVSFAMISLALLFVFAWAAIGAVYVWPVAKWAFGAGSG